MCGIVLASDIGEMFRMSIVLEHRGLDAFRSAQWKNLYLGFNRLAIIDLTSPTAEQPRITAKAITAFNGEIYNRTNLANGLERDGTIVKHLGLISEIEVIDTLMDRHPNHFERFLDGDYAIVRINKGEETVVLSRDYPGVVPLYYQKKPFAVASERKALMKPIEVQPGETITLSLQGRILKRRLFDPVSLHMEPMDLAHLEFLFHRAVSRRIRHSDVGACVALSGGLDSSLVLMSAKEINPHIEAVTVAIDPNSSELQNAIALCAKLDVRHRIVMIDENAVEAHKYRILYHLEDPIHNSNKYAAMIRNYFVAMAAPGKVILCGEGADEIGCGYPPHLKRKGCELEWKSFSTLRSMHAINLDRVNKGGMAWTKEFRVPFLDRGLILYCMGCMKQQNKMWFRSLAERIGMPQAILDKPKYTGEEDQLWKLVKGWNAASLPAEALKSPPPNIHEAIP